MTLFLLRTAAFTCAMATLFLNASYGWAQSDEFAYAVTMTAISMAIDVGKSTLLVLSLRHWREGAYMRGVLAFLLFWPCLAYSLHAGLSRIAQNRETLSAVAAGAYDAHARAKADYDRLAKDLATMEGSPPYQATAACARPRKSGDREFCAKVVEAQAALAAAGTTLSPAAPPAPDPQLALFAGMTGLSLPTMKFLLALWPILLAELCASVGFAVSMPSKAPQTSPKRVSQTEGVAPARKPETKPQALPGRSQPNVQDPRIPTIVWPAIKGAPT